MGEPCQIWKVFFPKYCLTSPSGICLGWVCTKKRLICVLGIADAPIGDILDHTSRQMDYNGASIEMLGVWKNDRFASEYENKNSFGKDSFVNSPIKLSLHQCMHDEVPHCELVVLDKKSRPTVQNILFILYKQKQLIASKPALWSTHLSQIRKHSETGVIADQYLKTDIERVWHVVHDSYSCMRTIESTGTFSVSCEILAEKEWTLMRVSRQLFGRLFCFQLRPLFTILRFLSRNSIFKKKEVHWWVRFPATGCQLVKRFSTLRRLVDTDDLRESITTKADYKQEEPHTNQRFGNIVCNIAVDVCLGITLMLWLQHYNLTVRMADGIMAWANTTGKLLQQLLQWLMGNPAGLKLNSALAHFLGHFFLYHVYLWMGYLTVIGPFLSMLIWCMALSGCLGLSILLAVASDMLSILTFHIYCFYVYATKIYSMQISGLLSLSRLFRGKKSNVLRRRVDSCAYDIDQLFIGTLLFTILLFLLPTTALFYTAFTLLRLVVLVIQSLLTKLVHLLNTLPVFSIILWAVKSETLTDGVEFHVKRPLNGRSSYLVMQVQPMSFSRVLHIGQASFPENSLEGPQKTVLDLGKSLLFGHLIYPWGGENRKRSAAVQ